MSRAIARLQVSHFHHVSWRQQALCLLQHFARFMTRREQHCIALPSKSMQQHTSEFKIPSENKQQRQALEAADKCTSEIQCDCSSTILNMNRYVIRCLAACAGNGEAGSDVEPERRESFGTRRRQRRSAQERWSFARSAVSAALRFRRAGEERRASHDAQPEPPPPPPPSSS